MHLAKCIDEHTSDMYGLMLQSAESCRGVYKDHKSSYVSHEQSRTPWRSDESSMLNTSVPGPAQKAGTTTKWVQRQMMTESLIVKATNSGSFLGFDSSFSSCIFLDYNRRKIINTDYRLSRYDFCAPSVHKEDGFEDLRASFSKMCMEEPKWSLEPTRNLYTNIVAHINMCIGHPI